MNYKFERNGDEFSFVWEDAQIAIGLEQIYEYHGEIYAEVWVRSALPTQPGHIHWGRLNLSATQSRERLASTLNGRVREVDAKDWAAMLETACTKTAIEYRAGEPTINLATMPRPTGSPYLIYRFLPLNVSTILFGDGGTSKSLLALYLGMAVKAGLKLPCGLNVMKTTDVMYLDWETNHEDHVERLHAIADGLSLKELPAIHYRKMRRTLPEEATKLRAEISRLKIGFVIVDSLGYASGGDLRENNIAINAMDALSKMNVTSLAIAHITKEAARESEGKATPFGSAFFSFSARCTWEIRKAEENSEGELNVGIFQRKANRGALQKTPLGLTIEYDEDEVGQRLESVRISPFSVAEDATLAAHAPLSYRLREALRKANGTPVSAEKLSKDIGAKEMTISRTLRRMKGVVNISEARGRGGTAMWVLEAS